MKRSSWHNYKQKLKDMLAEKVYVDNWMQKRVTMNLNTCDSSIYFFGKQARLSLMFLQH